MVKHNNVVPNAHFHKKWASSSRGPLKVKTWFHQPTQKKQRRLKRAAKAAKMAPRPLKMLRPAVMCPTQRYSAKMRLGRGFTLEELKEAKIAPAFAKTIGIAVDHRRVNKSMESLNRNVDRLKEYKAKLILFPRKGTKAKKGDSTPDQTAQAAQLPGTIMPLTSEPEDVEFVELTDDLTDANVVADTRKLRNELKLAGIRIRMAKEKEDKK